MKVFRKVGGRLKKWAIQVRNSRAEAIADVTKEAIRDLASEQYFDLPPEFTSYIEEYERREGALQSIADYRDHFIHPFHVFCLGYRILDRWIEALVRKEIERLPLYLTENQDPDYNLKACFIASIYHDVGFPSEKLEILIHDFFKTTAGRELRSQFDWSPLILADDNVRHIHGLSELFGRKSGNQDVANISFEKWFDKRLLEDHDHGALTALMLLSRGWRTEEEYNMAKEAALAIALHSYRCNSKEKGLMDFNIGQLPVENLPLAFFLTYCDSAQEWGRKVLLELIRKSTKAGATNTAQHFSGLNSKLEAPVPVLFKEMVSNGERIKTTVIIKYPIGAESPISGGETLREVFTEVAKRFQSTWYLRNQKEKDFWIQGNDVDDLPIEYLHPSPRPSYSKPA